MKNKIIINKVGVVICTRGWQKLLINGTEFCFEAGHAHPIAPVLVMESLEESEDFECVELLGELDVLFPLVNKIIPIMAGRGIIVHPIVTLDDPDLINYTRQELAIIEKLKGDLEEVGKNSGESILIQNEAELHTKVTFVTLLKHIYYALPTLSEKKRRDSSVAVQFLFSAIQNCKKEHRVEWYAKQASFSIGYFSRLIEATIGKTPWEMLTLLLVQNAKTMLDNSSMNIKQISDALGFPNQSAFRKHFERYTGMSPKAYRLRE